jgi:two-component system phosphate regulon sensor histidine kinase PhoR
MAATPTDRAWPAAFAFILALAAMPTLVFLLLVVAGELHWQPALWGWGICSAVAVGFGLLLGRDVIVMTRLLRGLQNNPGELPFETTLLIPGMGALGQEAIRLIRAERIFRARIVDGAMEDRALVERLPDPLIKLDAAGNVLWRNAGAVSAFGQESAALLRHPVFRGAVAQAGTSGQPVRRTLTLAVPVVRELDLTVIPVGGPIYVLITDRTRERSLEKMRADFVANSSHELRTPLASLIGFIETLRGPAADDAQAQQRFLGIMAEQAARMQRVIADLLSLSRIEISEHQPPTDLLEIAPLLGRIVAGMEPMLRAAETRMDVSIAPELPAVPGDADQLAQVFTNLFDNAIKYGKRGGCIRVQARCEAGGVIVAVADDGAGIAREHLPRLTERFYRVDKGRSRAVGGTGLGLAIVKHVVNRHRGRLVIDSTEGVGTVFTVWLPVRG